MSNTSIQSEIKEEKTFNEKEIIDYIDKILTFIKVICKTKLENTDKILLPIMKENMILEDVEYKEPYIMSVSDFDDFITYYTYIIRIFKYHLQKILEESESFYFEDYILKDLVDLCNTMLICKNKNECFLEEELSKFLLYHIINIFSFSDNQIEKSDLFYKKGTTLLIEKYKIIDSIDYFPKNIKSEKCNQFLNIIKDFANSCYIIYTEKIKNEFYICDGFDSSMKLIKRDLDEIINDLEKDNIKDKINNILKKLIEIISFDYTKIKEFIPYSQLVSKIKYFVEYHNDNDLLYSLCFLNLENPLSEKEINTSDFFEEPSDVNFKKLLYYSSIFNKYAEMKQILNKNNKKLFKDIFSIIIYDENFRKKVYNFYDSNSMKEFLEKKINKELQEKIEKNYSNFINYIKQEEFWNSIIFYTLSKYSKAFISNYMRIVINDYYIYFIQKGQMDDEKKEISKKNILTFYLFIILIHELMHFLRRYCLTNVKSKKAVTPPNSEETSKTGEIGEELIKYFFGREKIKKITNLQAEKFMKLTFSSNSEFNKLKEIMDMKLDDEKNSISIKFFNSQNLSSNVITAKIVGNCLLSYRTKKSTE